MHHFQIQAKALMLPLLLYLSTCLLTFYLVDIRQTHIELNLNSQYNNILGITLVLTLIVITTITFQLLAHQLKIKLISYMPTLILASNLTIDFLNLIHVTK